MQKNVPIIMKFSVLLKVFYQLDCIAAIKFIRITVGITVGSKNLTRQHLLRALKRNSSIWQNVQPFHPGFVAVSKVCLELYEASAEIRNYQKTLPHDFESLKDFGISE